MMVDTEVGTIIAAMTVRVKEHMLTLSAQVTQKEVNMRNNLKSTEKKV